MLQTIGNIGNTRAVSILTSADIISNKDKLPIADKAVGEKTLAKEVDNLIDEMADPAEEDGAKEKPFVNVVMSNNTGQQQEGRLFFGFKQGSNLVANWARFLVGLDGRDEKQVS